MGGGSKMILAASSSSSSSMKTMISRRIVTATAASTNGYYRQCLRLVSSTLPSSPSASSPSSPSTTSSIIFPQHATMSVTTSVPTAMNLCTGLGPLNAQRQQQQQQQQQQQFRSYHWSSIVELSSPSTSPSPAASSDDEFPSNLTFDFKSSFAPRSSDHHHGKYEQKKKQGILIEPKDDIEAHDNEEVEKDNSEVGESDDLDDDLDDDEELFDSLTSTQNPTLRKVVPLPDRLRQDVYHGPDGSVSGSIWLNESVFGVDPIRLDLIKQSVDYIRAKIRGRRKAKSKTISEKSGSGRKVRQQKGTGRARAGHSRPAHWRGGAKAHGPKNTVDYGNIKMNAKQKKLAVRSVLSQKCLEGNLIVIDHLQLPSHRTKDWANLLEDKFGIGGKLTDSGSTALILDHYFEPEEEDHGSSSSFHASYHGVPINLWVASSNLHKIKVSNQRFANVYDILKREKLVVTLTALEQIERRWMDKV